MKGAGILAGVAFMIANAAVNGPGVWMILLPVGFKLGQTIALGVLNSNGRRGVYEGLDLPRLADLAATGFPARDLALAAWGRAIVEGSRDRMQAIFWATALAGVAFVGGFLVEWPVALPLLLVGIAGAAPFAAWAAVADGSPWFPARWAVTRLRFALMSLGPPRELFSGSEIELPELPGKGVRTPVLVAGTACGVILAFGVLLVFTGIVVVLRTSGIAPRASDLEGAWIVRALAALSLPTSLLLGRAVGLDARRQSRAEADDLLLYGERIASLLLAAAAIRFERK